MERRLVAALAAVVAAGCSYGASFEDCQVACRAADQCPAGYTCGPEGLCRGPGTSQMCASVLGDAALARDAPPNGPGCNGTAAACTALVAMGPCNDQDGCGWTAPVCRNVRDCSIHQMSTQCDADPACFVSVIAPYCQPRSSWCPPNSSTPAQCMAQQYCMPDGGCQGTAALCHAYHDATTCAGQAGCTWQ